MEGVGPGGYAKDGTDLAAQSHAVDRMEAAVIVPERPVEATTTWHEAPSDQAFDLQSIQGAKTWAPRDVNLTYHGIQPVYDEWGRPVAAHVFRYRPMRLVFDSIEFGPSGLNAKGHYEASYVEYAFDASDGRYLGPVSLPDTARGFNDPDYRDPFVGGFESSLFLFMALKVAGPDLRPIPLPGGNITFTAVDDHPLPGECRSILVKEVSDAPSLVPSNTTSKANRDPPRVLVCARDGTLLPLWTWDGNQTRHIVYTRLGPSFALQPDEGKPLPPLMYEKKPWQEVPGVLTAPVPLPLPLLTPALAPASTSPTDYAGLLQARQKALYLSPDYIKYNVKHPRLWLMQGFTGFPVLSPIPLTGPLPLGFDEESWIFDSSGMGEFWGFVATRFGSGPEDPDQHVAERGSDFDIAPYGFPDPDHYPLPAIGEVQSNLADIAPRDPSMIQFSIFPDLPGFDASQLEPYRSTWFALESCFEAKSPQDPYMFVSARTGQLVGAGWVRNHDGGCSAGGGQRVHLADGWASLYPRGVGGSLPFIAWDDGRVQVLG